MINVTTRFRDDIQEETTTPQKGDYVFCLNSSGNKKIDEFLNNNIGQILKNLLSPAPPRASLAQNNVLRATSGFSTIAFWKRT